MKRLAIVRGLGPEWALALCRWIVVGCRGRAGRSAFRSFLDIVEIRAARLVEAMLREAAIASQESGGTK